MSEAPHKTSVLLSPAEQEANRQATIEANVAAGFWVECVVEYPVPTTERRQYTCADGTALGYGVILPFDETQKRMLQRARKTHSELTDKYGEDGVRTVTLTYDLATKLRVKNGPGVVGFMVTKPADSEAAARPTS